MERVEAFSAGPSEINARAEQHTLPDLYGLATASRAASRPKTSAALAGRLFSRFAVGQPSDCSSDKKLYRAKMAGKLGNPPGELCGLGRQLLLSSLLC